MEYNPTIRYMQDFVKYNEEELNKIEEVFNDTIVDIKISSNTKYCKDGHYYGSVAIKLKGLKKHQDFATTLDRKIILSNQDSDGNTIWDEIDNNNSIVHKFKKDIESK